MFRPTTILHPTDFSSNSTHALQIAADLAKTYTAKLLIVHVAETLGPENVTFGEVGTQLEPEGYQSRLRNDLEKSAPTSDLSIPVERLIAEGNPADEIVRIAKQHGCGLIVMGTHGRTGMSRLLMGSIAEQVMRHADCPVLTVRSSASEA